MKSPLRFEGISVSRSLSRGYPEQGTELSIKVLASRILPDGTPELVTLYTQEERKTQVISELFEFPDQSEEQHAARTAFMIMYKKLVGMADKVIVETNKKVTNGKKSTKRSKPNEVVDKKTKSKFRVACFFPFFDKEVDRLLEKAVGRMSDGSGFGMGERDICWSFATKRGAEGAVQRIKAIKSLKNKIKVDMSVDEE